MAHNTNENSETSSESLNGSWVNLDGSIRNGNSVHHSPTGSQSGAMEDLLAEAVEDHYKQNSNGEKSPTQSPTQELAQSNVPILPQEPKTDWIWEWSSGIERNPPKEWKLRHPSEKPKKTPPHTRLSLRKTKVMKSDLLNVNFYIVVPTIIITHLVAFGIGVYVGKKMAVIQSS